jgi:hypothetical protein
VVKNGRYGSPPHQRQRFRCHPADGSAPHNFAGTTPRLVVAGGSCDHCENPVAEHQGPRVARTWRFPVAQAAAALVAVGQGVSYTEAADRIRVLGGRGRVAAGAQMVANWVEVLGPVVAATHAETSWPQTVVPDSTWFDVTNRRTGDRSRAFAVLGAYGYPAGEPRGRTWALRASPRARQGDWAQLLSSLPGAPELVVCDDDRAIINAVRQVWPNTFVKQCEHHLRAGVKDKMAAYGHTSYGHPMMELLNDAFRSPEGWQAFTDAATGIEVRAWIDAYDEQITEQVRRRDELPDRHTTGALDEVLAKIREAMEHRAFCYRNAERTNRMLGLVRLRLNRADDPAVYARAIRDHLDANGGRLSPRGAIRDRRGQHSLR